MLQVQCHLLDQSRTVSHSAGERTFHVFYQIFAAMEEDYSLQRCAQWLFQGGPQGDWEQEPAGRSSAQAQHQHVYEALLELGFGSEAVEQLYDVIAGLMHLLSIRFLPDPAGGHAGLDGDGEEWLGNVAELWQVNKAALRAAVLLRVEGSTLSPLTLEEANAKRVCVWPAHFRVAVVTVRP